MTRYERSLKSVAREIGRLVAHFMPGGSLSGKERLLDALARYKKMLLPWAESVAERMVRETAKHNQAEWIRASEELGANLEREIKQTPVGARMQELQQMQVDLITSIPQDAARRVQHLAAEAVHTGTRYRMLAEEIMRTEQVSKSRAMLIARTETARASSVLTRARSEALNSTHYKWRTMEDVNVRPDHKKLNGRVFAWDDPPIIDEHTGERGHPGTIYNCRCYPQPILPKKI